MTKNSPELIVIDTCVYVDALYTGHAQEADVDKDRVRRSGNLLRSIDHGEFRAGLTPMVHVELNASTLLGDNHLPKRVHERKKQTDAYFGGAGHVFLEHDERVARLAAKLARDKQMKGPDSLIVATAVVYGAAYLFSWDDKVLKQNGEPMVKKLKIIEPPEESMAQDSLFEVDVYHRSVESI